MRPRRCTTGRGFSLIELMIAIAIVAVLASLAYPAYLDQVRKGRRADAKQALLDLAARQERFYTVNNRWASAASDLGYATGASFPLEVKSGSGTSYQLSLTVDASAGSYTATARPQGPQQADGCGDFMLTDQGVQSVSGSPSNCW